VLLFRPRRNQQLLTETISHAATVVIRFLGPIQFID